ncbi:hypothetical protein H2200_007836 [Cladophialophora chaetospira]|uniref:Uncharacterized protein n=1 Tax=Cladophialophora chaetospira TaxID=386627 RepID=A0AA38X6M8_9EURO|nr:hypothetical protein H2200_007836 [Cladophialophora chaetospira]
MSQRLTFILQDGPSGSISGGNLSDVNAHVALVQHWRRGQPASPLPKRPQTVHERIKDKKHIFKRGLANESDGIVPNPVILAGNSDPFSSTTINVTPWVNHLLIFTRDFILPANHGYEAALSGGKLYLHRYWRDNVQGLDDGTADGYAYLARSAAILSRIKPQRETNLLALEYIGKATSKLRESMLVTGDSTTHAWEVYALFAAEIAAHSFEAAAVHGHMLARLLQPEGQTITFEPRLLIGALIQDVTRACMSLSRPCLDLHRWEMDYLPAHLSDEMAPERKVSPSALPFYDELPENISDSLATLIIAVREWHHALGQSMLNQKLVTIKVFTIVAMKATSLIGNLLNHYLDSMELYMLLQSPEILAEACLGLAATYWVRRAVHDRLDMGSKLEEVGSSAFDMSYVFAIKLRELDEELETLDKDGNAIKLEDRLFWLFVGTKAERNIELRPDCGDYQQYHGVRFLQLADSLGLREWDDIVAVIRKYLYLDNMARKTKKWFLANAGQIPADAT